MAMLCVGAWFVSSPPVVRAADIDYPITVGQYIDSGSPTTAFTSKIKLVVNNPTNGTLTRGLIQLPPMPDLTGSQVTDVKLWLDLTWDNETNPYARGITLFPLTESFNAGTATWNNSANTSGTPGGVYDSTEGIPWNPPVGIPSSTNTNVWCSWDLTSLRNNPNLFANGAILEFDQSEALPATGFLTKQFANSGSYQPYIEVTSVPEPSSCALFFAGAGLLTVGFARRRGVATAA
jgi:hypothetical protein